MLKYARIVWRSLIIIGHILFGCLLILVTRKRDPSGVLVMPSSIVTWWHRRLINILNFQVTQTGQLPTRPVLLVSNHVSWVDIHLLGSLSSARFLSKDDVRRWPVIGWLASSTGTLFIKRGGGHTDSIAGAIQGQLQAGHVLALFPEGTTTDGRDVRTFFPRLFAAVIDTDIPVAPVAIRYHIDGEYDPVAPFVGEQTLGENLLGLLGRKVNQVSVDFCQPLIDKENNRKALAESARNAIVSSLNDMMTDQRTKVS